MTNVYLSPTFVECIFNVQFYQISLTKLTLKGLFKYENDIDIALVTGKRGLAFRKDIARKQSAINCKSMCLQLKRTGFVVLQRISDSYMDAIRGICTYLIL